MGEILPSIWSSSVWQTPQTDTAISISFLSGWGMGKSARVSGDLFSVKGAVFLRIIALIAYHLKFPVIHPVNYDNIRKNKRALWVPADHSRQLKPEILYRPEKRDGKTVSDNRKDLAFKQPEVL
jgi:hypothetical protein